MNWIQDGPHVEVHASELAAWLETQGGDCWWTVDGDPLLMGRLSLPCPGDELAAELRKINKPLLLADKKQDGAASERTISASDLDALVDRLEPISDRVLYLCWKGSADDWMLLEDEETSDSYARELHGQPGRS